MYLALKFGLSAALIVAVSELAKRSSLMGALVASLPLTSILAMVWLYAETGDTTRVVALSSGIFWLVLPSLTLFLSLPFLVRAGLGFYASLALSIVLTVASYAVMVEVLRRFGISL